MQQQVSRATDLKILNAAKCYFNNLRIGSGRDDKVILEPALVAVIDHIDSGINLRVSNASVIGDVSAPGSWIRAREVITRRRQLIETFDLRRGIGAF